MPRPDLGDTAEDELVDITQKPPQAPSPVGIGQPEAENIEEDLPQAYMGNIELCDILSPNIDAKVNIIPMIDTLTVYEDISKPYLLCDIAIRDSYGFRETIPEGLKGRTKIILSIILLKRVLEYILFLLYLMFLKD